MFDFDYLRYMYIYFYFAVDQILLRIETSTVAEDSRRRGIAEHGVAVPTGGDIIVVSLIRLDLLGRDMPMAVERVAGEDYVAQLPAATPTVVHRITCLLR